MTGAPVSVDNGQCTGDTVGGSVPAGVSVASGAKAGTVAVGSGVFGDIGPGFSLGRQSLLELMHSQGPQPHLLHARGSSGA